jgi:hypothetical protein
LDVDEVRMFVRGIHAEGGLEVTPTALADYLEEVGDERSAPSRRRWEQWRRQCDEFRGYVRQTFPEAGPFDAP